MICPSVEDSWIWTFCGHWWKRDNVGEGQWQRLVPGPETLPDGRRPASCPDRLFTFCFYSARGSCWKGINPIALNMHLSTLDVYHYFFVWVFNSCRYVWRCGDCGRAERWPGSSWSGQRVVQLHQTRQHCFLYHLNSHCYIISLNVSMRVRMCV